MLVAGSPALPGCDSFHCSLAAALPIKGEESHPGGPESARPRLGAQAEGCLEAALSPTPALGSGHAHLRMWGLHQAGEGPRKQRLWDLFKAWGWVGGGSLSPGQGGSPEGYQPGSAHTQAQQDRKQRMQGEKGGPGGLGFAGY